MNSRAKLLVGLLAGTVAVGGVALLSQNQKSSGNASEVIQSIELPKGKEAKDPLEKCLPENSVVVQKLIKVDQYTLFSHKVSKEKQEAWNKKRGIESDREHVHAPEHAATDQDLGGLKFPNIDVAAMIVDPFDGCKPLIKSVGFDPFPQSLPSFAKLAITKTYWVTTFKHVEEDMNVTAQSWLDTMTHYVGLGMVPLQDEDVKALNALGMELPKWYDPKLPVEKRWELLTKARSITDGPMIRKNALDKKSN